MRLQDNTQRDNKNMVVFQLKTGYIVVFPQHNYEMVVLSRKTGYIVVFPP